MWYIIVPLLTVLFSYMYYRLKLMSIRKEEGRYYPNIVLSLTEIIIFIGVFTLCILAINTGTSQLSLISFSITAFGLTLFTFNSATFKLLKFSIIPLNIGLFIGYFYIISKII